MAGLFRLLIYLRVRQRKCAQEVGKIIHFLEKLAKELLSQKTSTSKLNLKVQNIYIKTILKPKNCSIPCLVTAYLVEIVKNCYSKKKPEMLHFWRLFYLIKKSFKKLPKLVTLKEAFT
jgi:hypothetical protein